MRVEEKLLEFHRVFIQEDGGGFEKADCRALRKRLLEEEFNEYLKAEAENDFVEIADALADIVYIAVGTAVAYGILFDAIFSEVRASNMSKVGLDGAPIKQRTERF